MQRTVMILGLGLGLLGCPADGGGDTDGGTDGSSSGGTSSTSASASNSASETADSASESNSGTDSTSSSGGVGVSTGSADGSSSGSEGGSSTGSTGAGSSSTGGGGGEQGDIYDDCPDNECLDAFECTTVPEMFPNAGANWCTQACDPKGDPCPDAPSGTATPVCATFGGAARCALDCTDGDCPDGMECVSAGPAGNVCMWPPAEM